MFIFFTIEIYLVLIHVIMGIKSVHYAFFEDMHHFSKGEFI